MTLASLMVDETAIITGCTTKRLCDLGFTQGTIVRMIKTGSTCIICLFDTSICVGHEYQKMVQIKRKQNGNSQN